MQQLHSRSSRLQSAACKPYCKPPPNFLLPHHCTRPRLNSRAAAVRSRRPAEHTRLPCAAPAARIPPSSPPQAADALFERFRRAIQQARRTPTLVMRCARRLPSSFLATARRRRPFRGLPPSNPAGPPNTNAGNALRPPPAFLPLPPHAASPQFESFRRAILEPRKLSGP